MGVFRQLKVEFWLSPFILELPPQERSFYLYLLTNPATTQCGIYKLALHTIESQFGSTKEDIKDLIERFVGYRKIIYSPETNEFLIVNWMEHNRPHNPKMSICAKRELEVVNDMMLLECWKLINPGDVVSMKLPDALDTVTIPYAYRMDTVFSKIESWYANKNKNKNKNEKHIQKEVQEILEKTDLEEEKEEEPENETEESVCEEFSLAYLLKQALAKQAPLVKEPLDPTPPRDTPPGDSDTPDPALSPVESIIQYLNRQTNATFSPKEPFTIRLIGEKLERGFGVSDFLQVIDKKWEDWRGEVFEANLTPYTLFGDKFETYLHQKPRSQTRARSSLSSSSYGYRNPVSIFTNTKLVEV